MVTVEILISQSDPNDSRGMSVSPWFRSRAVIYRRNMDFPNPVHTKNVHKKVIPAGIIPACPACQGSPKGNSTYLFMYLFDRENGIVPVLSLRCITYFVPVFSYFSFCVYVLF